MNLDKLRSWTKDKHNQVFLLIIIFGIILRLYYLVITKNQVLWWDEAEYLLMAKYFAAGDLFMNLFASRPLLLPLLWALFMKIRLGHEIIFRLVEVIVSSLGLVFMYLVTEKLFNKETGIVSALLLSVFYLHLFYTTKLLLDAFAVTFWLISIYFFITGYLNKENNKRFYLSAFFGAVGVFFYNQTIALFITYLIFLLIVERLNLFKKKKFYMFGIIALLTFSPNFILNQVLYDNPTEFITKGISTGDVLTADYSGNLIEFLKYFPNYLGWMLLIIFIISLFLVFYDLFLGIDIIIKKPDLESKKKLFLFLWLIISFLVIVKIVGHFEDRYIMATFAPVFIIISLGLYQIKEWSINKFKNKYLVYALIILLLLIISISQVKLADNIIKSKKDSFKELKDAGLWIKENSMPSETILASTTPVMIYYSERKIVDFPEKEEDFRDLLLRKKPKYMVISVFTGSPSYVNNLMTYEYFNPVKVYQIENNLILAVFEIDYNKI